MLWKSKIFFMMGQVLVLFGPEHRLKPYDTSIWAFKKPLEVNGTKSRMIRALAYAQPPLPRGFLRQKVL